MFTTEVISQFSHVKLISPALRPHLHTFLFSLPTFGGLSLLIWGEMKSVGELRVKVDELIFSFMITAFITGSETGTRLSVIQTLVPHRTMPK